MTSFPYRPIRVRKVGIHWRPFATVIVASVHGVIELDFLVDSGADFTVLPKSVGEQLGFIPPNAHISHFSGVGDGVVPYVMKRVRLKIGMTWIVARVAWALEEITPILGRLDVFDQFTVLFDRHHRRVLFRR